ncbi:MAG: DUF805 domain-containing protein [Bdellovibrionales bacterium]|nr:DUF805 domain-containing protein [Bdellovibrionales bacterium]
MFIKTTGRVNRLGFWDKSYGAAVILLMMVTGLLIFISQDAWAAGLILIATFLYFLHTVGVAIRRLHDLGHPGYFVIAYFVPGINALMLLYLMFWPGQPQKNTYGEPDQDRSLAGVLVALAISLAFVGATSYYAVTNQEKTQAELQTRLKKIEKLQQKVINPEAANSDEEAERIDDPDGANAKRAQTTAENQIESLRKQGRWTAGEFFFNKKGDMIMLIRHELERFRELCGRLPSATQEGIYVLNVGKKAKLCPKWTGRVPRMSPEDFGFRIYFTKLSETHVALYTYGMDNKRGGEGPDQDWRMDIQEIQ